MDGKKQKEQQAPRYTIEACFSVLWVVGSYFLLSLLVIIGALRLAATPVTTPSTVPTGIVTWQLFVFVTAALLLIGLIIRWLSTRLFYELLLGAALFLGVWVYAWFIFPWEVALLVAATFTVFQARVRRVLVHDAFILFGAAGIALHFAFVFTMQTLAFVLVAFLIYDMFAGRPGGVATKFASMFIHRGAIPGLIVPGNMRDACGRISKVVRSPRAVFLGAGDLIIPLILVARAVVYGVTEAVAVTFGILIGAVWLARRGPSKPYPALIPMLFGAAVPFLIIYAIQHL